MSDDEQQRAIDDARRQARQDAERLQAIDVANRARQDAERAIEEINERQHALREEQQRTIVEANRRAEALRAIADERVAEERVRAADEERLVTERLGGAECGSAAAEERAELNRRVHAADERWLEAASRIPMRLASLVAQDRLTGAFARELARGTGPIGPDRVLEFTERAWWYAQQLARVLPWLKDRADGERDPSASYTMRRSYDSAMQGYYQSDHRFDVSDETLAGVLPRVFAAFEMLALTGAVEFPADIGETHAMVREFYDAPAPGPALTEDLRGLAEDLRLTSRDLPDCGLSAADVVEPFRFEGAVVIRAAPSGVDAAFASFRTERSEAHALCVQRDGGVIVVGTVGVGYRHDMAVVRFLPDGRLDEQFGVDGWAVIRTARGDARAHAAALQPDGRIVLAGESLDRGGSSITELALARLNSDGTVDASFNDSGVVLTTFLGSADRAFAVAVQDNGKILAAGEATRNERVYDGLGNDWFETRDYVALARYVEAVS